MFTKLTKLKDSFLETETPFYDCIVMKDGKCMYRHMQTVTRMQTKNGGDRQRAL